MIINFLICLVVIVIKSIDGRPLISDMVDSSKPLTIGDRSLASDAATYLLVPMAVVVGTEGAILGATGATFGNGIQSVGEGIKSMGDEIAVAGDNFKSMSRGVKGLSNFLFQWGTGGTPIPLIGHEENLPDTLSLLNKFPDSFSNAVLQLYFQDAANDTADFSDEEDENRDSIDNDNIIFDHQ